MNEFKESPHWERTILLELDLEYQAVCRSHRIKLRPINILLFDSETRWGEFDGLTRTISLSRKLITLHPWHAVVGVLRHEMAHQLVEEEGRGNRDVGRPHDDVFKAACQRLGLPSQYAKAGLDLKSCSLDWRTDPQDAGLERVLEKVKKLLALASSTNEHEAVLAMERVRELYAKYNLEQMTSASAAGFVHLVITHDKTKMAGWQRRIVTLLIEHFFVKIVTFTQFDPATGKRLQAIELIGTRENVLMAEYVYHFLIGQAEFLLKQADKVGRKLVRHERSSFRLGVLSGFAVKLERAEKSTPVFSAAADSRELTPVGEALEKFRKDKQIDHYLSEIYPRLGTRRSTTTITSTGAFAAGERAGRALNLNKPISTRMGSLGHLLGKGLR